MCTPDYYTIRGARNIVPKIDISKRSNAVSDASVLQSQEHRPTLQVSERTKQIEEQKKTINELKERLNKQTE